MPLSRRLETRSAVPIQEFFVLTGRLESAKGVRGGAALNIEKKKILRDAFFVAFNG
jgi:hypothetical protein